MKWQISTGTGYSLGPYKADMRRRVGRAAARATDKAAQGGRDELRTAMRAQRLGNLANVAGFTSDLKKGRVKDEGPLDVAGFMTLKGVKSQRTAGALDAYLDNETTAINPVRGRWLAIATPEIPRRAGRRKMTPDLYRKSGLESRIGPLVFVPGKHAGVAYLVAQDVTISLAKQGKVRRTPKNGRARDGRARVGIVAFVLIRVTRRTRRVNPREIAARWQAKLPKLLAAEMRREPAQQKFTSQISHSYRL